MKKNINSVAEYFDFGCGRCELGGTLECKVHTWAHTLAELRRLLQQCEVVECLKWSQPCYTANGKNIVLIAAFKGYCAVSFFQGHGLTGAHIDISAINPKYLKNNQLALNELLVQPGKNTQQGRLIKITSNDDITQLKPIIKGLVIEAIELAQNSLSVTKPEPPKLDIPQELQQCFDQQPDVKEAFNRLTPGRQRSYLLHIGAAKQSKTKVNRIQKCIPKIKDGLGFNEYGK